MFRLISLLTMLKRRNMAHERGAAFREPLSRTTTFLPNFASPIKAPTYQCRATSFFQRLDTFTSQKDTSRLG